MILQEGSGCGRMGAKERKEMNLKKLMMGAGLGIVLGVGFLGGEVGAVESMEDAFERCINGCWNDNGGVPGPDDDACVKRCESYFETQSEDQDFAGVTFDNGTSLSPGEVVIPETFTEAELPDTLSTPLNQPPDTQTTSSAPVLGFTELSATGITNFCDLIKKIKSWLWNIIPIVAILVALVAGVTWLAGGEKAGALSWVRGLITKLIVALFFMVIFNFIFMFLEIMLGVNVNADGMCDLKLFKDGWTDELSAGTLLSSIQADGSFLVGSLLGYLMKAKGMLLGLVGLIASIMTLIGGLQYVAATGPDAATKARNTMMYAALGVAVAWGANLVVNIFLDFF